ncbi:MAG: hypothetical protein WC720_04985 [Candidatus Shapirobacteria bacterium]|jgi:hypothetical protein
MENEDYFNKILTENKPKSNIEMLRLVLDFSHSPGINQFDINKFITKLIENEQERQES